MWVLATYGTRCQQIVTVGRLRPGRCAKTIRMWALKISIRMTSAQLKNRSWNSARNAGLFRVGRAEKRAFLCATDGQGGAHRRAERQKKINKYSRKSPFRRLLLSPGPRPVVCRAQVAGGRWLAWHRVVRGRLCKGLRSYFAQSCVNRLRFGLMCKAKANQRFGVIWFGKLQRAHICDFRF